MLKLCSYILLFSLTCNAQKLLVKTSAGMQSIPVSRTTMGAVHNGKLSIQNVSPNSSARFIVEVSTPPVKKGQSTVLSAQSSEALRLQVQNSVLGLSTTARIHRSFTTVMNGFSVSIDCFGPEKCW